MKRILNPATNSPGYALAAALIYAVIQAAVNVHAQHKALTAPIVVAIAGSVLAAWIRGRVTPVADPKDGAGNPLTPPPVMTAEQRMLAAAAAGGSLPPGITQVRNASSSPEAVVQLSDPERRRAEDMRLMFAPGTPSFYPYPGEQEAPSPPGSLPPAVQPPAPATGPAT